LKALPVHQIELSVGNSSEIKPVSDNDQVILFELPLDQKKYRVSGKMLNSAGDVIAGAYYIYIRSKIEK
jgi:hypothetical protein